MLLCSLFSLGGCVSPESDTTGGGEGAAASERGGAAGGARRGGAATSALRYPEARAGDTVDVYHGVEVADPFRWLEDTDSAETRAWIEAENAVTESFLAAQPEREALRERLAELWNYERYSLPRRGGASWFFTRNDGLQAQAPLYVSDAPDGAGRLLLDPNTFSADGTTSLADWVPSPDGALLAYSTSKGGSDWRTWRFLDVTTGEELPDVLTRNKFGGLDWMDENVGVVYSRFERPTEGEELLERNGSNDIALHLLGTPEEEDLVLAPTSPEGHFLGAQTTESRRAIVVTRSDWKIRKNEVEVLSLVGSSRGRGPKIIEGFDARYEFLGNDGDRMWFKTDLDAPNGRVLQIDLFEADRERWVEAVPERDVVLEGGSVVGGHLVLEYLRDAHSEVRVHGLDGALVRTQELPGLGSVSGLGGRNDDTVTAFYYTSFTTPTEVWELEVATGSMRRLRHPNLGIDPADFTVRQEFCTSPDGTRVPMFVVHRAGLELDGTNPTLLYGYGGFDISLTPSFGVQNLVWLEQGGVYVMANLRGGGEYGKEWHEAGTKLRKQNVFDDFIACAEWLIESGYTRSDRLAIAGGSNGGLLVGACMTQRPDLFGACVPAVGVMDMLRYQSFTIGWAWAGDYGTSEDPEEFAALHAYSPLHNLQDGVAYPATMVMTGDHDDRVVPGHSFKFAARLQAAQGGPEPVLIRIETRAGHGAGKSTQMRIEEAADELTFLRAALGVD